MTTAELKFLAWNLHVFHKELHIDGMFCLLISFKGMMRDGWIFFITLHAFFRGLRNLAVSSAWVKLTKLSGSRSLQPVAVQDIIQSHINRYSNAWQHRWLACVRGAPMQGLPNWVSGLCIACPAFIAAMSIFHVSIHTNAQCKRNQRQKVLLYKKSIKKQINLNPPFFF